MNAAKSKTVALLKAFNPSLRELKDELLTFRQMLVCLFEQLLAVHLDEVGIENDSFVVLGTYPAVDAGLEARSGGRSGLLHVRVLGEWKRLELIGLFENAAYRRLIRNGAQTQ